MFAAKLAAVTVPDEWEAALAPPPPATTPSSDMSRVSGILGKLSEGESLRALPYRVEVAAGGGQPNAFATLGGVISVTPELLSEIKTEAGLAFVLAHEMGHHEKRHVLSALSRRLLLSLVLSALGADAAASGLAAAAGSADLAYSRSQEAEADEFAARMVTRKFADPSSAVEFLEKESARHQVPGWFSTHPDTARRLEMVRGMVGHPPNSPQ